MFNVELRMPKHLSRTEYLRQALALMRRKTRSRFRAERFRAASHRVRRDSMRVNAEFDAVEQDVDG